MGLFDAFKKEELDLSKYDKYYNPNGYDEELLQDFKEDFYKGWHDDYKNDDNRKEARKRITYNFLRSYINEESVQVLMSLTFIYDLIKAWRPEEIVFENNVFKAVVNNERFPELIKEIGEDGLVALYNAYSNEVYANLEYVNDNKSIIYNKDLYKYFGNDQDTFNELVNIDFNLYENPQKRDEILYIDGEIRNILQIRRDYQSR